MLVFMTLEHYFLMVIAWSVWGTSLVANNLSASIVALLLLLGLITNGVANTSIAIFDGDIVVHSSNN